LLVIEHYVAPSTVHGLGVFTKHFIPKGSLVWRFHRVIDREITRADLEGLPEHVVESIKTHAEYLPSRDVFRLGGDGDYYMNHSDEPNVLDRGVSAFAARDICAGEELLCDYRTVRVAAFDPDEQAPSSSLVASGGM
jgi:uncharacterized protein